MCNGDGSVELARKDTGRLLMCNPSKRMWEIASRPKGGQVVKTSSPRMRGRTEYAACWLARELSRPIPELANGVFTFRR